MIEDKEIDLTSDHKFFIPEWQLNKNYTNTYNKISTGRFRTRLIPFILDDGKFAVEQLPWNCKKNQILHDGKVRTYASQKDDILSIECGCECTIRSTSDNTFLVMGQRGLRPEVLEELFMEVLGYIPYTSITRCIRCGSWVLNPHAGIPFMCDKCVETSYFRLPWQRSN